MPAAVDARALRVAYDQRVVVDALSLTLQRGAITTVVGPNGCGKSTVLRSLARLLRIDGGTIHLDGRDIARTSTKEIARKLAILPQSPDVPSGVTVWDLVGYGRFPHQGLIGGRSKADQEAMRWAIAATNLESFADRMVDTLSGGERQRAWIAMALAQQTDVLLLDEPTTFLDIHYQLEVLQLVQRLNRAHGITVGMVLHDLNHAAAYSDQIVMLKAGRVVTQGPPRAVMTPGAIREVFGIDVCVIPHPLGGTPVCLPTCLCGAADAADCPVRPGVPAMAAD